MRTKLTLQSLRSLPECTNERLVLEDELKGFLWRSGKSDVQDDILQFGSIILCRGVLSSSSSLLLLCFDSLDVIFLDDLRVGESFVVDRAK